MTAATVEIKEGEDVSVALTKTEEANAIVKKGLLWSMGLGLVPVPIFDVVAVTAVQLKMVKNLADHYDVKFSQNGGKTIIASLLGGVGGTGVVYGGGASLFKAIPFVGPLAGGLSCSVMAGATTYAIGKVFIMHFETGGTFLNFNPEKMKAYFAEQYAEGKVEAEKQKTEAVKEAVKETVKETSKKDTGKK